jgi:hypothetical protein
MYEKPSMTEKYFDRNARPRNIPDTKYHNRCPFCSALNIKKTDKKENSISGTSVITTKKAMLAGETMIKINAKYAFRRS